MDNWTFERGFFVSNKKTSSGSQTDNAFYYEGFGLPENNYFRMPKEWTDITSKITSIAEVKVVEYILKHTWGYQEYGLQKKITTDEFIHGRRRKDGTRLDNGTGLDAKSVRSGLRKAVVHGLIVEVIDDRDKGRIKKYYSIRMRAAISSEEDIEDHQGKYSPQIGNISPPDGEIIPSRGVKFPHRTEKDTLERNNRDVVVINALSKFKVEEEKAKELAAKYSPEHIAEKIEFLEWKLENKARGRPIADPASWLIRAIEKDYEPPATFKPKAEREREAEQLALQEAEREQQYQALQEEQEREKDKHLEKLQRKYGTTQKDRELWEQVLEEIKVSTTHITYQTWFPQTHLLSLKDGQAIIGVPNQATREWLSGRLATIVQRALESVIDHPVDLTFQVLEQPQNVLE